jgi:hypothetical protein
VFISYDKSVGKLNGYGLDEWNYIFSKGLDFILHHNIHSCSVGHPAFHVVNTGGPLPGNKAAAA